MKKKRRFWNEYKEQIKTNKLTFAVYVVLRAFVIFAMVLSCIRGDYENLFFCGLSLALFLVPAFVEKNFGIDLPCALEIVILLFIFAAEILGEMGNYYMKISYWDTMLHTINGFLCAAVGFAMVDILNRNEKIKFQLSPIFLAIVAFCFSMTIGVLWEFFEYFWDCIFRTDMQKDVFVDSVSSVLLGDGTNRAVIIDGIKSVVVDGKALGNGGYLDIGLHDTMNDLLVNFVGAFVFCVIGFFYVKSRGQGKIAKQFIPKLASKSGIKTENNDGINETDNTLRFFVLQNFF